MLINRAYAYRLQPTQGQLRKMARFGGAARYAWNWLVALTKRENDAVKAAIAALTDEQRLEFDRINALRGQANKVASAAVKAAVKALTDEQRLELKRINTLRGRAKNYALAAAPEFSACQHPSREDTILGNAALRDALAAAPWFAACQYPINNYTRLYKEICNHRDTDAPWLWSVHSHVYSNASRRLADAYKRWLKGEGGEPRFHKRGQESFMIQIHQEALHHRSIQVPMIGRVRVVNELVRGRIPETAKVSSVTCRAQAGRWEGSVCVTQVEIPDPPRRTGPVVGIDLGINAICTIARSDRPNVVTAIDPPRPLASALNHLAALQTRFAFRQDLIVCEACKGTRPCIGKRKNRPRVCECGGRLRLRRSNRAQILHMRIARLHDRVSQIRKGHLHKISHEITGPEVGARTIVVEGHDIKDLVSKGVAKTRTGKRRRKRRQEMLDLGWGELRRQVEYKSKWRGVEYLKTTGDFKTDQTCAVCGTETKMPANTSAFKCSGCGNETTRQANTAWLLVGYGSGGDTRSAGGDPVHGRGLVRGTESGLGKPMSRDLGVNGCIGEDVPVGRNPHGEPRKQRSVSTNAAVPSR